MTTDKSERLLNLLITLLVARHYVTKERIRAAIPQYADDGDEAFEKKFERDKEDLRSLGVPIEIGNVVAGFDDETGYRVRPDAFALPQIDFTPDEAAVLMIAAQVWEHAGLAASTSDALLKLRAAGLEVDRSAIDIVQPRVGAEEPSFDAVWQAVQTRTVVRFDYRAAQGAATSTRTVEPWGIVGALGRWYLVAQDRDRGEVRVFRLSRISGRVRTVGKSGAFQVPPGTDVRALTQGVVPAAATLSATLAVAPDRGHGLRRRSTSSGRPDSGPSPDWDRLVVVFDGVGAAVDELLAYGADVVVESPPELRDAVVERLRGVLA